MVHPNDIKGFYADESLIDKEKYIFIDYFFESSVDPRQAGANLCSEQSTAQWKRPGVNEDFRPVFGAKIIHLNILSESNRMSSCLARVAHPIINFGPRIPNLLSAIAGEGAFYCPGISTLKIKDIHFPEAFIKQFAGPQFGVEGLRKILDVYDRPLFFGVVKPNIGLDAQSFAEVAYQSYLGGLDIAKDDEMLADAPLLTLEERIKAIGVLKQKAEGQTGRKKIFVANITDENDEMLTLYKKSVENGANALMLNVYFTGMSSLKSLRRMSEHPILAHFTGAALFERMSHFGIEGVVFTKIQRLLGADVIVMPGFGDRMKARDENVLGQIKACLEPMGSLKQALPVPGGSDWAGTLPAVYQKIGHTDFGFIAGRGIYGHPLGPAEGARSLMEAWEAIRLKKTLEEFSNTHKALKEALLAFGEK